MFFPTEKKIKKIYVVPAPPNQLAPQKLMTALASGEKKISNDMYNVFYINEITSTAL